MAKFSFETAVDIQAPKDQIYNYVADFPRHTEWNHQPQQMTSLTSGPARVGSQYKTEEDLPSNIAYDAEADVQRDDAIAEDEAQV